MKLHWIFRIVGITLALLCISCTGFFEIEGEEEITDYATQPARPAEPTTFIYFDNSDRRYAVDVFSDPTRTDKIVSLSDYQSTFSTPRSWDPSYQGFLFYFIYYLPLSGYLQGEKLPFIPRKFGGAYSIVVIPRNETTRIRIPDIYVDIGYAEPLTDKTYLAITNNYVSAIYLGNGNSLEFPIDRPRKPGQDLINYGVTVFYELDSGANISGYYISRSGNRLPLPADPGLEQGFRPGYLYYVVVDGNSVTLPYYRQLTPGSL